MHNKSEYSRLKMSKLPELRLGLTCLILYKHIMLDGFIYLYTSKDHLTKYRWIVLLKDKTTNNTMGVFKNWTIIDNVHIILQMIVEQISKIYNE